MSCRRPVRIVADETFPNVDPREVMTAHGESSRLFLTQITKYYALEAAMRTHEFREIGALVRIDEAKFLQSIQCVVEIRDFFPDDD
jgi:hypothetical protein